jgi:two-component system cell cycle sensor histidine kinase/response regulator CckA
MPNGGKLSIRTSRFHARPQDATLTHVPEGDYVLLEVSDTGCGMDVEVQQRIFEPFFTTKGPGLGTGLGLYTVYGIVCQCSGHILVRSKRGSGTTFSIYFPMTGGNPSAGKPTAPGPYNHGEHAILLVEDDSRVRTSLADQLTELGYAVISAQSASDALQLAVQHNRKISLLLTDIVMPQFSGPELARRMKETQPSLKVLFITGYPREDQVSPASLGPDSKLLIKPFTLMELGARIHQILGDGASTPANGRIPPEAAPQFN